MLSMPTTRKKHISDRDRQIHALVCRRDRSLASIGEEFGLTGQRVHQISREMDQVLYAEMAETIHELKASQTTTLRHVVREAMRAWEDSKRARVTVHTRRLADGTTYRERTVTRGSGNSVFLDVAQRALADIRKIWGADAPKQVEIEANVNAGADTASRLERISERMRQLIPEVAAQVVDDGHGDRAKATGALVKADG